MDSQKPIIFVSCGQYTDKEKQLGRDICSLIERLRPDVTPYFAEYQSTVEGLSNHILGALYRSAGFICVMHRRGDLTVPGGPTVTRGSVWIEQEIAITAFMNSVLERSFPTLFYKQAGVHVEGIRSVLLMNSRVEFDEEDQVLEDLKSALPRAVFKPFILYDLEPVISYRLLAGRSSGEHHVYELTADVQNIGREPVTDFEIRVRFPRKFLSSSISYGAEDKGKATANHRCFIANEVGRGRLYNGDRATNPLTIEYFMDRDLEDDPHAMNSEIIVELFSNSMPPKRQVLPISSFQDF